LRDGGARGPERLDRSIGSAGGVSTLLGTPDNGLWRIAPVAENVRVSRRYRPNTLILETEFATAEGEAVVIDFMPLRERASHVMRLVVLIPIR
jgi:GH15 family glucan-1,4-alpha-glucosidase